MRSSCTYSKWLIALTRSDIWGEIRGPITTATTADIWSYAIYQAVLCRFHRKDAMCIFICNILQKGPFKIIFNAITTYFQTDLNSIFTLVHRSYGKPTLFWRLNCPLSKTMWFTMSSQQHSQKDNTQTNVC